MIPAFERMDRDKHCLFAKACKNLANGVSKTKGRQAENDQDPNEEIFAILNSHFGLRD